MEPLGDISSDLNELAQAVQEALKAGAVVVMALVKEETGPMVLAVGSTGLPNAVRLLARSMPDVATELLKSADSEIKTMNRFRARTRHDNAN